MTAPAASPTRDVLTQTDAEARAARIADVSYDVTLALRHDLPHMLDTYD